MIRGGIWQKQRHPSLRAVRPYQRCHATPVLRAYSTGSENAAVADNPRSSQKSNSGSNNGQSSTAGGWGQKPAWGSTPGFAQPSFAPSAAASSGGLLPHEIWAKERAARLLKEEEARLAKLKEQAVPQIKRHGFQRPTHKTANVTPSKTRLPLDGAAAQFSKAPKREQRQTMQNPTRAPLKELPFVGFGAGASLSRSQSRAQGRETAETKLSMPQPALQPTTVSRGWGSDPQFGQSSAAESDLLLPHEREARERALRSRAPTPAPKHTFSNTKIRHTKSRFPKGAETSALNKLGTAAENGQQEWGQLTRRAGRTSDTAKGDFWSAAKNKYPSGLPDVPASESKTGVDAWSRLEAAVNVRQPAPVAQSWKPPPASNDLGRSNEFVKHEADIWDQAEGEVTEAEATPKPLSAWEMRQEMARAWVEEEGASEGRREEPGGRRRRRTRAEIEKEEKDRLEREAKEVQQYRRGRVQEYGGRKDEWEDDDDNYRERRRRRLERQAAKERARQEALLEAGPVPILLPEFISVAHLGTALNVRQDIFLNQLGELGFEDITSDSILTGETAALVAQEYGFEPTVDVGEDEDLKPRPPPEDPSSLPLRPPVVTIMGHVDHGKTTLLDYLRKSSIVSQEHGGITQHIGAFSVTLSTGKQITFLDTPGHAAFLSMRQRGANVTDIVILVVAADDSVKPQTLEALKHARSAKVPIIVAINKVDKDSANVDRVKSDLANHGVEIEDYGGDVQTIPVSGKTGQGMADLEESIITLSEMLDIRAEPDGMAEGWVLESSIKPIGRVATVLVKRGTLRPGDHIVAGRVAAKIRSLRNEAGVEVDEAPPGTAVEILGWKDPPDAGDMVLQAPNEDRAKRAAHYREELKEREENIAQQAQIEQERREKELAAQLAESGEEVPEETGGVKIINFTVKGDVHGSVEAVCAAVLEIGNNEVRPRVLQSSTGQITESDVEHASISGSTILNFNNPIPGHIKRMAEDSGVKILDHNVIYHLAEAVRDQLSEQLTPIFSTRVVGEAEILQVFPINVKGRVYRNVAGCRVRNGQVTRHSKVRVLRDGEQLFQGDISSLKHGKKDMTEIKKGSECGISFAGDWSDFQQGDLIQIIEEVEEKRHL